MLGLLHVSLWFAVQAGAQDFSYQTEEFRDDNSTIPVMFACMFAGHQSGLDVEATETATNFFLAQNIPSEKIDAWAQDAKIYVTQDLGPLDWAAFWRGECEQPFANMRNSALD